MLATHLENRYLEVSLESFPGKFKIFYLQNLYYAQPLKNVSLMHSTDDPAFLPHVIRSPLLYGVLMDPFVNGKGTLNVIYCLTSLESSLYRKFSWGSIVGSLLQRLCPLGDRHSFMCFEKDGLPSELAREAACFLPESEQQKAQAGTGPPSQLCPRRKPGSLSYSPQSPHFLKKQDFDPGF